MYLGRFVERGRTDRVVNRPQHPYTEALLSAVPETDPRGGRERVTLDGKPADAEGESSGCRFAPRCPRAVAACLEEEPDLDAWTARDHSAACFRPAETDESTRLGESVDD
jgi:peptide/nickel transport system ATP-binding protein